MYLVNEENQFSNKCYQTLKSHFLINPIKIKTIKKSILHLGKKLSTNELKNITGSFNDPDEYGVCKTRFGFFCGVPNHICCNYFCVLPGHAACGF